MTQQEAVALALSLFARYPTATRVDKGMTMVWANEFIEFDRDLATSACLHFCRRNPSRWMPSLDEFRTAIVDARAKATKAQPRLAEPPLSEEQVAEGKRRVRLLMAGFDGKLQMPEATR